MWWRVHVHVCARACVCARVCVRVCARVCVCVARTGLGRSMAQFDGLHDAFRQYVTSTADAYAVTQYFPPIDARKGMFFVWPA